MHVIALMLAIAAASCSVLDEAIVDDCQYHFEECLDSPLADYPGGVFGRSICYDCFTECKAASPTRWPRRTWNNQPCDWWNYTIIVTGEPQ